MPTPNPRKHTEEEIQMWVLRKLGAPVITVHLTECQLHDAFDDAMRWYAAKVGWRREWGLTTQPNVPAYSMPDDADNIVEVLFESNPLELSLMAVPGTMIPDAQYPWYAMSAPAAGGLYSAVTQTIQTVDIARRVISIERNWLQEGRKLYLQPTPQTAYRVIAYYKSRDGTLDMLTDRQHQFVKRYVLARAKETLGQIYSRYGSFPAAQGSVQLNGDALLAQAEAEIELLNQEILTEGQPLPILAR